MACAVKPEKMVSGAGWRLCFAAFTLFKIAAIVQQIYCRNVKGHTADERFKPLILMVVLLSRTAEEMIQKGKI